MPVELLRCSEEMEPFFKELPMPKGLNGNEERFMLKYLDRPNIFHIMEVFRRMQNLHDAINAGRFFLCEAQRQSFPEVYKEPIPPFANVWISTQYLTSSIQFYNSAFDLYLQVNWIYFELYKYFTKYQVISTENLDKILKLCKVELMLLTRKYHKNNIPKKFLFNSTIYNAMCDFYKSDIYKEIHNLCNSMKHRKRIDFKELMDGRHQLYIDIEQYNSHDTLLVKTIPFIVNTLKEFHKEIATLCNTSVPFWSFDPEENCQGEIRETVGLS